jgi:hypothetical protein
MTAQCLWCEEEFSPSALREDGRGDYICKSCIENAEKILCPGCEVALESNRGEIRREGERFFCRFCGEELHDYRLVDWNIEEPENGRTNLTAGGHDR